MRFAVKPKPKDGDTRIIERFLIFPTRIGNEIRWLETIKVRQIAKKWYDMSCGASAIGWEDVEIL